MYNRVSKSINVDKMDILPKRRPFWLYFTRRFIIYKWSHLPYFHPYEIRHISAIRIHFYFEVFMHDIVTNNFHLFVYTNSIIFTSDHQNQSSVSTHGMIKCMLHTRVYTPLFTYFYTCFQIQRVIRSYLNMFCYQIKC